MNRRLVPIVLAALSCVACKPSTRTVGEDFLGPIDADRLDLVMLPITLPVPWGFGLAVGTVQQRCDQYGGRLVDRVITPSITLPICEDVDQ